MIISVPWWLALLAITLIAVLASAVAFFIECDERGVRPRTRVRRELKRRLEHLGDRAYDLADTL